MDPCAQPTATTRTSSTTSTDPTSTCRCGCPTTSPSGARGRRARRRMPSRDSCLQLTIPPDQGLWCPGEHDPLRVSGVQSGVFSGPVGSTVGPAAVPSGRLVREAQETLWGWTPRYGRLEMRARMDLSPRSMAAWWLVGLEDQPERCGELCVVEVFGDAVTPDGAAVGMGVQALPRPAAGATTSPRRGCRSTSREFHTYAVDWTPDGAIVLGRRLGRSAAWTSSPTTPCSPWWRSSTSPTGRPGRRGAGRPRPVAGRGPDGTATPRHVGLDEVAQRPPRGIRPQLLLQQAHRARHERRGRTPDVGGDEDPGVAQSGWSGGSGSGSVTSSAARMRPAEACRTSASVSTTPPRATLTSSGAVRHRGEERVVDQARRRRAERHDHDDHVVRGQQGRQLVDPVHRRDELVPGAGPARDGRHRDLEGREPRRDRAADRAVARAPAPACRRAPGGTTSSAARCGPVVPQRSPGGCAARPGTGRPPARRSRRRGRLPRWPAWRPGGPPAARSRTPQSAAGPAPRRGPAPDGGPASAAPMYGGTTTRTSSGRGGSAGHVPDRRLEAADRAHARRPSPGRAASRASWSPRYRRAPHRAAGPVCHPRPVGAITIPILPSRDFDVDCRLLGRPRLRRDRPLGSRVPHRAARGPRHRAALLARPQVDRWTNDVACYIRFDTPDEAVACHAAWAGVTVPEPPSMSAPRAEDWGAVEFHVIDLHGNLVRLGGFPPRDTARRGQPGSSRTMGYAARPAPTTTCPVGRPARGGAGGDGLQHGAARRLLPQREHQRPVDHTRAALDVLDHLADLADQHRPRRARAPRWPPTSTCRGRWPSCPTARRW